MSRLLLVLGVVLLVAGGSVLGLKFGMPSSELLAAGLGGYKLDDIALPAGAAAAGLGLVLFIAGLLTSGGKKPQAAASPKMSPMNRPTPGAAPKPAMSPTPAPIKPAAPVISAAGLPASQPAPPLQPTPPPAAQPKDLAPFAARSVLANSQLTSWSNGEAMASVDTNQQTADNWLIVHGDGGVGSVSVSKVAPPPGLGGAIRIDVTKGGNGSGWFGFRQIVSDVRTLAGQNVVVGLWARATVPILTSIGLTQNSDSAAPPSNVWSDLERLGPEWKYYAVETALPAMGGIETGPDAHLVFHLLLPTSGEYKIEVTGLTLAPAGAAG